MVEKEAIYRLKFEADKQSSRQSIRAVQDIENANKALVDSSSKVSNAAARISTTLDKLSDKDRGILRINEQFEDSIRNGRTFAGALEVAGRRLDQIGASETDIKNLANNLGLTTKQANALNQALSVSARNDAFDAISRQVALAGDFQSNLGALRGLTGAAGLTGVAGGLDIAGEFVVLAEELPRLKTSLEGLPQTISAAAQAIGGTNIGLIGGIALLTGALLLMRRESQKSVEALRKEFETRRDAIEFIKEATTEEIRERLEATQRQVAATREFRDTIERELSAGLESVEDEFGKPLVDAVTFVADTFGGGAVSIVEYQKQLDTANSELDSLQTQQQIYIDALGSTTVATNDAIAAERALLEERERAALQQFELRERQREVLQQVEELVQSGDLEGIADIQREIEDQVAALQRRRAFFERSPDISDDLREEELTRINAELDQLGITLTEIGLAAGDIASVGGPVARDIAAYNKQAAAQQEALEGQIAGLQAEIAQRQELENFLRSVSPQSLQNRIQGLEDERAALEEMIPSLRGAALQSGEFTQQFEDAQARLAAVNEELSSLRIEGGGRLRAALQSELTADIDRIMQASSQKIAQLREDLNRKEAELFTKLQSDIASAANDARQERVDAQRELGQELADLEEENAANRLKIIRRANSAISTAIGNRDALAAFLAKQQRDEELQEQEDAFEQQQKELQKAYDRQLEEIDRQLQRQQDTIRQRYQQQLQDLQVQMNTAIQQERTRASAELAERRSAHQQQLSDLARFATDANSLWSQGLSSMLTSLANFTNQANSLLGSLSASTQTQISQSASAAAMTLQDFNNFLSVAGF